MSLSFDGTKVPTSLALSTSFKAFIGGSIPNHVISEGQSEDWIKVKLASDSDIEQAKEIKLAVLSLQHPTNSKPCFFVAAVQPQTINMVSSFNDTVISFVNCYVQKAEVLIWLVLPLMG